MCRPCASLVYVWHSLFQPPKEVQLFFCVWLKKGYLAKGKSTKNSKHSSALSNIQMCFAHETSKKYDKTSKRYYRIFKTNTINPAKLLKLKQKHENLQNSQKIYQHQRNTASFAAAVNASLDGQGSNLIPAVEACALQASDGSTHAAAWPNR